MFSSNLCLTLVNKDEDPPVAEVSEGMCEENEVDEGVLVVYAEEEGSHWTGWTDRACVMDRVECVDYRDFVGETFVKDDRQMSSDDNYIVTPAARVNRGAPINQDRTRRHNTH
ncbi:hypothetical protein SRHO_G00058360 [Serrasalmus rhombeus]